MVLEIIRPIRLTIFGCSSVILRNSPQFLREMDRPCPLVPRLGSYDMSYCVPEQPPANGFAHDESSRQLISQLANPIGRSTCIVVLFPRSS